MTACNCHHSTHLPTVDVTIQKHHDVLLDGSLHLLAMVGTLRHINALGVILRPLLQPKQLWCPLPSAVLGAAAAHCQEIRATVNACKVCVSKQRVLCE